MNTLTSTNENMLSVAEAFAAAASESGNTSLPILKLSKAGQWVSGADADPVVEKRFYANVAEALCGAICFIDGGVAECVAAYDKDVAADLLKP